MTTKDLIATIETATGKSISQLKSACKKMTHKEGWNLEMNVKSGVSIVWVSNRNYCGGEKNGYGQGLYALLQSCGTTRNSYKIS